MTAALTGACDEGPKGGRTIETFPAVGVREDYRFSAGDFLGAALVAGGRLAHLMAFPV